MRQGSGRKLIRIMDYRIIKTGYDIPDVLLHRDRDDEGNEVVEVKAIGTIDSNEDQFAIETVKFPNADLAFAFIRDFTKQAATDFCERNGVSIR